MKNINKYLFLYAGFIALLCIIIYTTELLKNKNISFQEEILLKQAQTHFKDQINTRKWNSKFGGVYVKSNSGLKPNPYLKDNVLNVANGQTLIKINSAWMTKQLSEISNIDNFSFRIVGLDPINPDNKTDKFETRALEYIIKNNTIEYYELKKDTNFKYMGALLTLKSCLPCHAEQGYKTGDVKGGISINLDTSNYNKVVSYIHEKVLYLRVIITLLLLSITLLIRKQFKNNENLENEILNRIKEVVSTKVLLQEVLDTDHSFLMVASGKKIILSNKSMLDFFNCRTLEEFIKRHTNISDFFVDVDSENYLSKYINNEYWISYLYREQDNKDIKVLIKKNEQDRYFKAHSKKIIVDNEELYIIVFDEITKELQKIKALTDEASKDALTDLFNRGKFDEVLSKEISLTQTTKAPLSIIFLDIDHFKIVNDTYGHDAGDYVLVELAKIIKSTIRQGDFAARWGGEEFIITLQSTTAEKATLLANKIRKNIKNNHFKNGGKQTASLGVTQYIDHEEQSTFTKRVDDALYEAKKSGRNRVVTK